MKKRFQLLVLSVLCVAFARAQYVAPSEGVFRIINVAYDAALMENYESNELRCTSTIGDADDFDQLWILKKSGSGYSIQNAYTGAYIQTGNTGTEVPYWTGTTAQIFNIRVGGSKKGYNIFDSTLGAQGLHSKGANGNVVRWVDCEASEWQFEKVEVSEEAMTLAQAEYAEYLRLKVEFENYCAGLLTNQDKLEAALAKYFEDAACTVLKEEFTSVSEEDLRSAMAADNLPTELIDMAVKVKTGEWAEDNEKADKPGWNSHYAKKFRVQMIEPHSIAGEITTWIGHQGHTNMDNPTGLYGNKRQVLYVMVEGEVKDGAELYATWLIGHDKMPNYNNGYGDRGVTLKPGLNIVPIRKDGCALYFNYLVHTLEVEKDDKGNVIYDNNGAPICSFAHKLSDFEDLKIHVAGGYINGYYNVEGDALYTPDNDDDWVYYEERANLENITILGRYEVLQFEFNDVINYTDDKGSTWSYEGLSKIFPEMLPEAPKSPAYTGTNQKINAVVEAWDRIFLAEKMTLGVASKAEVDSMNKLFPRYDGTWTEKAEIYNYDDALYAFCDSIKDRDGDYGEYYNHRGVAFGTRTGYMYGSWDHSGYHINTTATKNKFGEFDGGGILRNIAVNAGTAWGPAHEIGHQHQALYTLNGEMEVTNNTFANVAVWYMGMGTSRLNGEQGNLANVYDNYKNGGYLLSNNIWVLTQRYYRLWLYYHRVGNNTQFFPRLFELIRLHPMERSYGSGSEMRPVTTDGKTTMENVGFQLTNGYRSYLHFYKLCCEAAQEDLTEFFRAYGCFTPVDGVFQGDYTNSKYYTTQKEIDQAIAEVKAKGYPENFMPLFINDCTNEVTYGHDGKTARSFWDPETGTGKNAEVGSYVNYLNETPITGEYVYTLNGATISISGGKGAVGFAIFNDKGEIQAFSNHHSFELNDSVIAHMLIHKDCKVLAIAADGNHVEVPMTADIKPIAGSYQYTLSENKLSITGGMNAAAFGIYNEDGSLAVLLKGTSYQATDEISRGLALGKMTIRAYGVDGNAVNVPAQEKELGSGFVFALNGNTVNISGGANALCYIIYSKDGEEQAYSGNASFMISDKLVDLLASESSCIKAIGSNGSQAEVNLELLSYFLASLETARMYTGCGDETGTRVGMFYPDSLQTLTALVAQADVVKENEVKSEYYRWIVSLDSAVAALLANKGASIPFTPDCYYHFSPADAMDFCMGTVAAGLNAVTEKTDLVQWRIIPTETEGIYYMQNRETGNYISSVVGDSRPQAASSNIADAVPFKFVLDVPGEYYIRPAESEGVSLYYVTAAGSAYRVMAGEVTESMENQALWTIRLVDDMLSKPETVTEEQMTLYYLQRTDNNRYAYRSTGKGKTGRISSGEIPSDLNYWFYFCQGNEEGKYAIYNYKSGYSLTLNSGKVYSNKATDVTVDYSIERNEEGNGLIISAAEGNWYIGGGELALDAELSTAWRLQRICYVTLALDKTKVSISKGESETLSVVMSPSVAAGAPVAWSINNEEIATVDANGQVTGVAEGSATITATVGTLKATCEVTVTPASGIDAVATGLNIRSQGSVIVVEGVADGTEVNVYNVVGSLIGSTTAIRGTATIDAKQADGAIVIVKVGASSIKCILE